VLHTVPVLAVLICHDGAEWLPSALDALGASTPRPRHVLAVDTGSTDATPELLRAAADGADPVLSGVLTLDHDTGFAAAVHEAVAAAVDRWGDPGAWIWVLHDDCAPEPDCLASLLNAADAAPSAGVLGPLGIDWDDPRLVVDAGLSTDASGHRQTGMGAAELDWSRFGQGPRQSTEVLAVSSAGMLVRRELWHELSGFDAALPLGEDVDFGWRVNAAGSVVLCVPAARVRHVRAVSTGARRDDTGYGARAVGVRTFLVNCATPSFLLGVPRLVLLCLLRALGFAALRRLDDARAELAAVRYVLGGAAGLRAARAQRRATRTSGVRGLYTSRLTRLRNALRAGVAHLVRRRVEADVAIGRLADDAAVVVPARSEPAPGLPVGPRALPAGAAAPARRRTAGLRRSGTTVAVPIDMPAGAPARRRAAGLRRPGTTVAVPVDVSDERPTPSPRPRPSPVPRGQPLPSRDLVFVQVSRARLARQILLAPPVLLVVALTAVALLANAGRLGLDLSGGRLLPVGDLAGTWSEYLATWHPVAGGTAAPAPPALAVVGGLGAVLGGTKAAVAVLLLGNLPLAGLAAYVATRRLPVLRWTRALVAAGYALLPPATAAVAQGRLDVAVVHILLPLVTAGVMALLGRTGTESTAWLSTAAGTAFGLAVLGAFSPLTHVLLLVFALAGFVLVPARGGGRRRGVALFVLVLLPVGLLLPWPAVLIGHPEVLAHGVGGGGAQTASVLELVGLHPGGPGAWPVVGIGVVLAALVAILSRPSADVLAGLGLALCGLLAVVFVVAVPMSPLTGGPATTGWTGAPLLVLGWGLLLALLTTARPGLPDGRARVTAAVGLLGLAALAASTLIAGGAGPLGERRPLLAATLDAELADTGRSVLVLPSDGEPARAAAGRAPRFGDDDLAPVNAAAGIRTLATDLTATDPKRARAAVARAAAAGVLFVVLPDDATADRLRRGARDLVADTRATTDGRPVMRLQPAAGQVTLLSPKLARAAVTGGGPPTELDAGGIVPVEAGPPVVSVQVSDGSAGRLLVLAAEAESGWRATINGRPAPITTAWGHLVSVAVPARASSVVVEQSTALRAVLLLTQAAIVLFTALTAMPTRPR
jgi:GT2 family glycosyltransferase